MDGWGWVVCRLVLGLAQMVGAVVGACLLVQTGNQWPDVGNLRGDDPPDRGEQATVQVRLDVAKPARPRTNTTR
jgi:hypothetical protein